MILKYYIGKMNEGYYAIENLFMDALRDFSFIDIIDYDGENINLIFNDFQKNLAKENELVISEKVKSTIKTLSLCA